MLDELIRERRARVGVMGLGYVGLPLASACLGAGYPVIGFDTDPEKIRALGEGRNYLQHLGQDMTRAMADSEAFEATADFARLGEADIVIVCVPTPLGPHKEPDLRFIERSAEAIAKTLRPGQLIVLESTTYPGTTRNVMGPILAQGGLEIGVDYFLAYSPEREDPGRKDFDTRTIPKLVGGTCATSGDLAHALYASVVAEAHRVRSAEVAEAAKLLENIFRSVNIALVNELKVILDAMDIDVWEVIDAAATKPFGFMRFTPGPGLGGHCIPIDPYYLTWVAKRAGHATKFIELAGEINTQMPRWVVQQSMLALNGVGKAVRGSRVLVLGLAYKPDVDDVRESPAIELIEELESLGAQVSYSDPHVAQPPPMRAHDLTHLRSVELTLESLRGVDLVLVATDHSGFDWDLIAEHAPLVIDTRNALESRLGGAPHYHKA